MKSNFFKTILLTTALVTVTTAFAQTPGGSPGSPSAPGSENVNPRKAPPGGPGGPGYDAPAIDISRPNTNVNPGTNGNITPSKNNEKGDPEKVGVIEKDVHAKHIREGKNTGIRKEIREAKRDKDGGTPKPKSDAKAK